MRRGWMLLLALGLASCSQDKGPEEVVRSFYQIAEFARQNDFGSVQGELYGYLSAASRESLDGCGSVMTAGAAAGGGSAAGEGQGGSAEGNAAAAIPPGAACLVFSGFEGTRGDLELKRLASGPSRVRMEVTSGGVVRYVELILEDGWKIDLAATAELNSPPSQEPVPVPTPP